MIEYPSIQIEDAAPLAVTCELEVYTPPSHLRVQREPEITLKRVEFADGSFAENDSDHARIVASRFNDPQFLEHDSWADLEQKCREEYRRIGNGHVGSVVLFMDAQRRAMA